ncbi:MAG TPA: GreA/GreB family elongation factor [Burkholderiales bacterium]|nr:GreA/GreB family elongation factor [Burkholderiales bacterium]
MKLNMEPSITKRDASLLRTLLHRIAAGDRGWAADEVGQFLDELQVVDVLPGPRVGIDCQVRYIEGASGESRAVSLQLPGHADPKENSISIFSPVGRALLGRAPGDRVTVTLPGNREDQLVIVEVTRMAESPTSSSMEE